MPPARPTTASTCTRCGTVRIATSYRHHVVMQGRLQYILSYSPATTATNTALLLRDETMNLLRAAVI